MELKYQYNRQPACQTEVKSHKLLFDYNVDGKNINHIIVILSHQNRFGCPGNTVIKKSKPNTSINVLALSSSEEPVRTSHKDTVTICFMEAHTTLYLSAA